MNTVTRLLPVLLGMVCGCTPSDAERDAIIAEFDDISFCCDAGEPLPITAGDFVVQVYQAPFVELDPDTIQVSLSAAITNRTIIPEGQHTRPEPVRLSVEDGAALRVGSNTIEVFIDSCDFERVDVEFVAEVTGRRIDDRTLEVRSLTGAFVVTNTCPPTNPGRTPPQIITETILGAPVEDFGRFAVDVPTGVPTANPSSMVEPQIPPLDFTETFQVGALVTELDAQQLDRAFTGANAEFPIGRGDGVEVLSGTIETMQPGRYLLAWQCVAADIPLEPADLQLQFGLVFDRDGDPANNFQGFGAFDQDLFRDTDTWFAAAFDAFGGWSALIQDATGRFPVLLESSARIILQGQVQYFAIPVVDLGEPASVTGRWTAFAHDGSFGIGGDWSADATPPVGEPLIPIDLTPFN